MWKGLPKQNIITIILLIFIVSGISFHLVLAGAPSGDDTFELTVSPTTGGDNTGDGGTGDPADYNYFYVGQSFITTIQIVTGGSTAANIWIDYDTDDVSASNLTTGSFYDTWNSQSIDSVNGRVYSTGFNVGGGTSNGSGSFGTVTWEALEPTEASYGTSSADTLDINVGVIGETTESNISLSGVDILDDEEDFQFHIWADTVKPFAENFSPATGTTNVSVTDNYTFDLRDTLNGEGDNTGVGTGVNTSEPPGVITFNSVSETDDSSYSCSGIWGTNLCQATVNPDPPSGISGDTRNFEYNTAYTVSISGFQDLASSSQDQLGDANGPNTMDTKVLTFTTEGDTVAPQVVSESPTRASANNSTTTNITVAVEDRKTYPSGASGTGIDSSTCRINVSSPSSPLVTYQESDSQVSTTAIDYGYQFVINPDDDFAENETVTVSVYGCTDLASNEMTTDTYTFTTLDASTPYVDEADPDDDEAVDLDGTITFHIKDDGVGVDLSETVVYVNGVYYTDGGGSGSVTTTGTSITFDDSLDFNGSNYVEDTTEVSGTFENYTFVIDPENDFAYGESVPVLIYSEDTEGNLMEREVLGVVAATDGSSYCGIDTSWSGTECESAVSGENYCGSDTSWSGSECEADVSGEDYCGTDTSWDGSECDSDISGEDYCGTGTDWNGSECESDTNGSSFCGEDTVWNGSQCVSSAAASNQSIETSQSETSGIPEQLFDINLDLEDNAIKSADELVARVSFTNFGTVATPVNLTFRILDQSGNEVYSGQDNTVVETELVFTKRFEYLSLPLGNYTVELTTLYNTDVEDVFTADFEVIEGKIGIWDYIISHQLLIWLMVSVAIVVSLISLILAIKKRRYEK